MITVHAMREEFSSTTQRQRESPSIGKLQTHLKLKNQNRAKSKFKAMSIFFYVKGVVMFVFFMKIRMKRCVDAKGEYIKGETK